MVYLLLSAVTLVLCVTGFIKVYCLHGIDQVYLGLYKGLFDEAVVVVDSKGEYLTKPKFYLLRVRTLLEEYFEVNLSPYCRYYTYTVTAEANAIGLSLYSDYVHVAFTATINDIDSKHKEAVLTIERGDL